MEVVSTDNASDRTKLVGHKLDTTSVDFSPDGRLVVTGSLDGTALVWRSDGAGEPIMLSGPVSATAPAAELAADKIIADILGGGDETAAAQDEMDEDGLVVPQVFPGHASVLSVDFSPGGNHVLLGLSNGIAEIWRADGTGEPETLSGNDSAIVSVTYTSDGSRIVLVSFDGTVQAWHGDGKGERVFDDFNIGMQVDRAAVSTDGSRILTASREGYVQVWHENGTRVWKGRVEHVFGYSADLKQIAIGTKDGVVRVLDIDDPDKFVTLTGHIAEIARISFSLDGLRVATSSKDGMVRIWRSDGSGEPIKIRAVGHNSRTFPPYVWFSPDGEYVLAASIESPAQLWRVDWTRLLEYLRSSTTVCLTAEDRTRYLNEAPEKARFAYKQCEQSYGR